MRTPLLFDQGAAPLGSNGRTRNREPKYTGLRPTPTPPAHYNAPPGTSSLAAVGIVGRMDMQRAAVLAVIVMAGALGATGAEIEAATGIRAQSVSPRRGELRALGLIVDSGRRRATPRGRSAAVWVAVAPGPQA